MFKKYVWVDSYAFEPELMMLRPIINYLFYNENDAVLKNVTYIIVLNRLIKKE